MRRPLLALLAPVLIAAACGDEEPVDDGPRAANACVPDAAGNAWSLEDATATGAYRAGFRFYTFVDTTRPTVAHGTYEGADSRTLETRVFYPATADGMDAPADPSGGPYPVVLYSHGFSSSNGEGSHVARLLASVGYVVLAPRFPSSAIDATGGPTGVELAQQPRDLSFLLDQALALSGSGDPTLGGMLDVSRVAAAGLSMGGITTLLVTYHATLRDPRVKLAIAMAPVASPLLASFYDTTDVPALVLFGNSDAILPYQDHAVAFRDRARSPRTLLTLELGTHTGFTSVAVAFENIAGYEHADSIGCSALGSGDDEPRPPLDYVAMLGAENGVENPTPTAEDCPDDLGPGMRPSRQHLIEGAAVRAQLDAYFSTDPTIRGRACHFGERVLPREEDVAIDRR